MDILLKGVRWRNGDQMTTGDVRIGKGLIREMEGNLLKRKNEHVIELGNHFLYPGLINAHDHLEMNLYPKLGTPPYSNYVEWASDIYKPTQSPLLEIEKVNINDRLLWGGIKNLISGVTTVVHHNPWHRILGTKNFPVKVLKKISWAHSLALEKRSFDSFLKKNNTPFIIHAAEGTDEMSFSEIGKLKDIGLLTDHTVLIHAIALREKDIEIIFRSGASIVWCPASNQFMFGQTAPIQKLKGKVKIALGSDSTLTGSATLLGEMQAALQTGLANAREICEMVTRSPSEIFHLPPPSIGLLQQADLFICKIKQHDYFQNLVQLQPADISLVMVNGEVRLLDAEVNQQLLKIPVNIQGVKKNIDTDIISMKKRIEKKVKSSILEANPLWKMVDI